MAKYFGADWYASQIRTHLLLLVPNGQVSEVVDVSVLCSTAMVAADATVRSRLKPLPAVSVNELEEPNIAMTKSLAFTAVTPVVRTGCAGPPAVFEAVAGYPVALSQTVKVAVGSSAPLIAIASALIAVGTPITVTVTVTDDRVLEATPCHSSNITVPAPGLSTCRAEESNVIPGADRLNTEREVGFSTTTTRIESGFEFVESPEIVKVLPVVQVPVCFAFTFESMAGALPILMLWLVPVSAVPEVVLKPSHLPAQVPTKELPR
jgi:hypothetical protein